MISVNRNNPDRWKADIAASIDLYNSWFLEFAPKTYRVERSNAIQQVQQALALTDQMTNFTSELLYEHPEILYVLRMSTAPPLARDRLIGLTGVRRHLVNLMEKEHKIPSSYDREQIQDELKEIGTVIRQMLDDDIYVWIGEKRLPTADEVNRAAVVVADRLTGAVTDPIVRNAQEKRQLEALAAYLDQRGYRELEAVHRSNWQTMPPGTYALRMNVNVVNPAGNSINIPIDTVVQPFRSEQGTLLIEAKAAGDFTNTNKRRKEEAQKMTQLRGTYGENVRFILFLCGYFDSGYLGYEAAEGIDWVWEHRIEDLSKFID